MKTPHKILPIPGDVFDIAGQMAFLIRPTVPASSATLPWVWYAPTLPSLPGMEEQWMFQKFIDAGLAVAGIDVGESYGNPSGRAGFSALYAELTRNHGLSRKAGLLARSRGGLMLYNWAAENPSCVACVAGIYPVCNLSSYPGLDKACAAYGLTEAELGAHLAEHNPIERLAPLAKAQVPIFHIHGDCDTVVPLENNSGELAQRYQALGGKMALQIIVGQGHNLWPGWFQCEDLIDFVIAQCNRTG
jgi:pimeloyl-ACP methyl ester carboxylesterase